MPRTIPDTNHVLAYNQNEYYKDHVVSDKAKKILEGAWDLHVHCSPAPNPADVNGGLDGFVLNDFELVTEARQAGMRGLCIKNHEFGTFYRAWLATKACGEGKTTAYGSLTLGYNVGGINPFAVQVAADCGAKLIWFPTTSARNQHNIWGGFAPYPYSGQGGKDADASAEITTPLGIYILDEEGNLIPGVKEVIEIARDKNIALATGHMSWLESIALFKEAKKMGLKKMIFTHVDWRSCELTLAQQHELTELGVFLEKSFYEFDKDRALRSFDEIEAKHFILSSDMGMFPDLRHIKGFACEIDEYLSGGISEEDLMVMTHENPAYLMEG